MARDLAIAAGNIVKSTGSVADNNGPEKIAFPDCMQGVGSNPGQELLSCQHDSTLVASVRTPWIWMDTKTIRAGKILKSLQNPGPQWDRATTVLELEDKSF